MAAIFRKEDKCFLEAAGIEGAFSEIAGDILSGQNLFALRRYKVAGDADFLTCVVRSSGSGICVVG